MRDVDKGIQRIEIPLTEFMVDRMLAADSEDEMFRILSAQHTGLPRFDSRDVLKLSWDEAGRELQREDFVAVAIPRVARGHRLLAEFAMEHGHCLNGIQVMSTAGDGGGESLIVAECARPCGESIQLLRRSLRPLHMDPDEPHHLDILEDLEEVPDG